MESFTQPVGEALIMLQIQRTQLLDSKEMQHAVECLYPLHAPRKSADGPIPWSGPVGALVAVADPEPALPVVAKQTLRAAAESSLAARRLLAGQVVTVGLLGADLVGQLMLAGIVRYVPEISHVSLYAGDRRPRIVPGVLDQLDLAGIGFAPAGSAADAVRGANLVIACDGTGLPDLRMELLSRQCVVVNASGIDLPDDLVHRIDAIYVDDLRLLASSPHRYFARSHLATTTAGFGRRRGIGEGRQRAVRVSGDFHRLTAPRRRPPADRVVLVELLCDDAVFRTLEYAPANVASPR
jgi:Ornithine cyclodeaminase/mu-crystallin family